MQKAVRSVSRAAQSSIAKSNAKKERSSLRTYTTGAKAPRVETDTFGPIDVPSEKYWGAQTQRCVVVVASKRKLALQSIFSVHFLWQSNVNHELPTISSVR
jgi:hypothetical protein